MLGATGVTVGTAVLVAGGVGEAVDVGIAVGVDVETLLT
jgi:hypothetical protein